jgi:flagellar protein FlbD
MIKLTRLDGSVIYINVDLIETVEESPDTHITLSNGNRYLVLEKTDAILDRIIKFKAAILHRSMPGFNKKYLRKKRLGDFNPMCEL